MPKHRNSDLGNGGVPLVGEVGVVGGCKCVVRLLDDAEIIECEVQPRCKAQYVLDYVCIQLDVVEKDYFGLRYVDHRKQRKWFDFTKSVANQVKDLSNLVLCFRVKFYPPDPMRLQETTRYQLFLQLKRDLQHGRLYSPGPGHDLAFLAALCLQEELGDYDPERHLPGYVSEMNLVLNQTERLEAQVEDFHSGRTGSLPGMSQSEAVTTFLKRAVTLETYGIDPHPVKDPKGVRLYLGTNHSGVSTFHNGRRTHHFRWLDISKLNYEGRMFIIHIIIMEDARTKKKHTVGFKCATSSACRQLWRYSVEQRIFFTFTSSADIPAVVTGGSFFSRGSKVRYSGRVERELSIESKFQNSANSGETGRSGSKKEVNATVAAAAAALLGGGRVSGAASAHSLNVRSQRVGAFGARRSASEPVRDFADDEDDEVDDEEEEEDLSFASSERMTAGTSSMTTRRREMMSRHHQSAGNRMGRQEEGSSASASTKTSSLVQEGHDSYEASSCGSDDRSDVASWVALDLRAMRRQQQQRGQHSREPSNGYDTLTIDSADFYGYAPSQTGSTNDASIHWTPGHESTGSHNRHSSPSWTRDGPVSSRISGGRHSASPAHYLSSSRYRDEAADGWTDSVPRRRRVGEHHHPSTSVMPPAVIPLPASSTMTSTASSLRNRLRALTATGRHHCRAWTKRVLLLGTSIFTAFSLMALTLILVYETDFHWAIHLRHWPEMVFIQRHLYVPFRNLFPL